MVGTHAVTNVCSWISSTKMSRTISSESRGPERAFIILSEYDKRVLEIWDQPQPIKITKVNKNGQRRAGSYTPDFMLLTDKGPRLVEVKPEAVLEELIVEQPGNWVKRGVGSYHYLPAEAAFRDLGMIHQVFAYSHRSHFWVENLELMIRTRSSDLYDPSLPLRVDTAFGESFSWSLFDLKERLSLPSYTGLIQLLDRRAIFADLKSELLSQPESCFVAPSLMLVEQSAALRESEQIFSGVGISTHSISEFPSYRYAQEALDRLERLKSGEVSRSARRWKDKIKKGQVLGLSPFQSLISKTFNSGNRIAKINKIVSNYLDNFLLEDYAPSQGLGKYRGFIKYKANALEAHSGFDPVSRRTFMIRLLQIPEAVIAAGRAGKRGANAVADPSDPVVRNLKPQIPWQSAAIDHYKADVYLIFYSNEGVVHVERPWVTAMIDLATGCVIAATLSFCDPSRVSCAKVIRECVRLHARLPSEVIVDRGSDFKSVYFSSLLAHYGVTLSLRPSAHSRYGGEVEGLFGEFKKQWLTQRPGNVADYKEARSVDGSHAPKKSAVLRIYDFYRELRAFCSWRDAKAKTIHLQSGAERFSSGQRDFPFMGVPVEYDEEFMLITSVDSKKYKVDLQRGIHINELFYYSPSIAKVRGRKSKLEVRRDPENPHVIYAFIDNVWEPCYSAHINQFSALKYDSQFERGLVAIEASNLRRKLHEEADLELARLARDMNTLSEQNVTPIVQLPSAGSQEQSGACIFDELDLDDLRELTVGEW